MFGSNQKLFGITDGFLPVADFLTSSFVYSATKFGIWHDFVGEIVNELFKGERPVFVVIIK